MPQSLASRLRSLIADRGELERLRKENASLMVEVKALRQDQAEIEKMLGGSGRGPGRPRGSGAGAKRGPGRPKKSGNGGKRFRTTAADVEKMYHAITAKAPSDWKTKAEIIKAAGLSVDKSAAAWKWATEGVTLHGKKHAPVLKPNGERGLAGRYRKA
ncbi:MAG: hypothetical protein KF724_12955 [Phycisphaeraceae bacterium]|nr:hypothetical protein [Phycisphaeraceae bacterium]